MSPGLAEAQIDRELVGLAPVKKRIGEIAALLLMLASLNYSISC